MKIGVILLNLGGPDSLKAVKPFLYNLFSDRYIISLGPPFMQRPLAWLISTLRASKARKAYAEIGGASPILRITESQAGALEENLKRPGPLNQHSNSFSVYTGMRYWSPLIQDAVRSALDDGVDKVIGLTLYPHYSRATTGSTKRIFDKVVERFNIKSGFIKSWFNHPLYIEALAETIKDGLSGVNIEGTNILFSAHSLPVSLIEEGDPYVKEVEGTISAVIERLKQSISLPPHHLGYQSRSGPVKWLQPSTDEMIVRLAGKGIKRLLVVPVSFVSDHVETLYEIDILYRRLAESQGMELVRAASLNTHPIFISALKDLVLREAETIT